MSEIVRWTDLLIDPARRAAGDPGVSVIGFPSGIDVAMSGFEIAAGTEITFPEMASECRINAIFFLSGQMDIRLGNGGTGQWQAGTACLLRSDTPGFRLFARDGGWMSHVCVSMTCSDLVARFPEGPPEVLLHDLHRPATVDAIQPLAINGSMTAAATALHAAGFRDAFERSRCEPLALQFMLEALAALLMPGPDRADDAALTVERAGTLHKAVARDPSVTLDEVLGPDLGLRERRMVLGVFEARYGMSLRRFRQKAIMDGARAALMEGAVIKQLAYALGYNHVANFSRAYSRAFGESPSQTLRRRPKAPPGVCGK